LRTWSLSTHRHTPASAHGFTHHCYIIKRIPPTSVHALNSRVLPFPSSSRPLLSWSNRIIHIWISVSMNSFHANLHANTPHLEKNLLKWQNTRNPIYIYIYIYIYINYFTAIFKGKKPRKLRKISILIGSSGIGQCSI
jgi:hypothetical protein